MGRIPDPGSGATISAYGVAPPGNLGGPAGYRKIAEDASPFPRDRVLLNYDYYNNTTLTPSGLDVHQWTFGGEKTFLDQALSVEVRLPLARTLDTRQVQRFSSGGMSLDEGLPFDEGTELGNLQLIFKGLLHSGDHWHWAAGMGLTLPTADDVVQVDGQDRGLELTRINNQTVLLQPYTAVAWTPTPNLFVQGFMQFNFDTRGNDVYFNTTGLGTSYAGTLQAPTLMHVDLQLGYWLYRNPCTGRGFAPFLELHYNTTLQDEDIVTATVGSLQYSSGYFANRIDDLNLTAGFLAEMGPRMNMLTGVVVPLKSRDSGDRAFDYQIGVRLNWFYGATARARGL